MGRLRAKRHDGDAGFEWEEVGTVVRAAFGENADAAAVDELLVDGAVHARLVDVREDLYARTCPVSLHLLGKIEGTCKRYERRRTLNATPSSRSFNASSAFFENSFLSFNSVSLTTSMTSAVLLPRLRGRRSWLRGFEKSLVKLVPVPRMVSGSEGESEMVP